MPQILIEQKLEFLEMKLQNIQLETLEMVTQEIVSKFKANPKEFIPEIQKEIEIQRAFKRKAEVNFMTLEHLEHENKLFDSDAFQRLEFNLRTLKMDMDLLQQTFTKKKIEIIDETKSKLEDLEKDLNVTKIDISHFVKMDEIEKLHTRFFNYIERSELDIIEQNMEGFVQRNELEQLSYDISVLKKNENTYCKH